MENFFISLLDENFGIFGVVATLGSKKKCLSKIYFFACIAHSYFNTNFEIKIVKNNLKIMFLSSVTFCRVCLNVPEKSRMPKNERHSVTFQ